MEKLPIKTVEEEFNSMNFGKNAIQDNKYRGIDSFRIDQYNKWDTASDCTARKSRAGKAQPAKAKAERLANAKLRAAAHRNASK